MRFCNMLLAPGHTMSTAIHVIPEPLPTTNETRVAAYLLTDYLERLGVDVVFGLTGHTVIGMLDALGRSRIRYVSTRHEQVAAHAADGYARATGKPGVLLTHLGPGLTNAATGVANAIGPVPKHTWQGKPWNDPAANPEILRPNVVSGAFVLKEFKEGESATFERNPEIGRQLLDHVQQGRSTVSAGPHERVPLRVFPDYAALMTVRHGGSVSLVERTALPSPGLAAATLRY